MSLTNPLLVQFQPTGDKIIFNEKLNMIQVPINYKWNAYTSYVDKLMTNGYDYIITSFQHLDKDDPNSFTSAHFKLRHLLKQNLPVFDRYKNFLFRLDNSYDGHRYIISDDKVMNRFNSFDSEDAWQEHQSNVMKKLAYSMPLQDETNERFKKINHKAVLTDPSRGLDPNKLDGFFTWKHQIIIPSLMDYDMVGIPGIDARLHDFDLNYKGKNISSKQMSLQTSGMTGAFIPMKNHNGHIAKGQIATDISSFNISLKARAENGKTIAKSEFYDKKLDKWLFTINGEPSDLKCVYAFDKTVRFQDKFGEFDVKLKQDIKDILVKRGYDIPDMIKSLNVQPKAKYIWLSQGSMVGSVETSKIVTPSNAGFIVTSQPKPGGKYTVLIAEGALKGVITGEFINSKDSNGISLADTISKDNGIIIAQVPGVSPAFIKSVLPITKTYDVEEFVVAMDADGRYNRAVAQGIHDSEKFFTEAGYPSRVLSWDPEQKGIDDALLAIHRHEITVDDLGVVFGTAHDLFPLDKAKAPIPIGLDGKPKFDDTWDKEYEKSKLERMEMVQRIQAISQVETDIVVLAAPPKSLDVPNTQVEEQALIK